VLSSFLLMISWLLSPNTGFSGLAQLWDRSLLNIGTPFEQWLADLANLAAQQRKPDEFLEAAMDALVDLPWIVGVKWQIDDKSGMSGVEDGSAMWLSENVISVTIYTHRPGSSILLLHCNLLIQLLEHFYLSKLREHELAQRTHLQAIHETGARVTHDIKNLLQSLHTITMAMKRENGTEKNISGERRKGSHQLLQRQLPHLTQRLQLALDKLQAPEKTVAEAGRLNTWWHALQNRNSHRPILFTAQLKGNPNIPTDLFDSVVENLLENAHNKRLSDPGLQIKVKLICDINWIVLTVCDNGNPVNAHTASGLFQHAV
jgi:signal transduction histidine kinase